MSDQLPVFYYTSPTRWCKYGKIFREQKRGLCAHSQAELAELMSAIWAKTHTDSQNHYSPDMVSRMERNPGAEEICAIVIYVRGVRICGA